MEPDSSGGICMESRVKSIYYRKKAMFTMSVSVLFGNYDGILTISNICTFLKQQICIVSIFIIKLLSLNLRHIKVNNKPMTFYSKSFFSALE